MFRHEKHITLCEDSAISVLEIPTKNTKHHREKMLHTNLNSVAKVVIIYQ